MHITCSTTGTSPLPPDTATTDPTAAVAAGTKVYFDYR